MCAARSQKVIKLVSVQPLLSPSDKKKYQATFKVRVGNSPPKTLTTKFGAKGYEDYTTHRDPKRRENYRARHKSRSKLSDPTSAGALSWYLLWGPSTNLSTNVKAFVKQFNL